MCEKRIKKHTRVKVVQMVSLFKEFDVLLKKKKEKCGKKNRKYAGYQQREIYDVKRVYKEEKEEKQQRPSLVNENTIKGTCTRR